VRFGSSTTLSVDVIRTAEGSLYTILLRPLCETSEAILMLELPANLRISGCCVHDRQVGSATVRSAWRTIAAESGMPPHKYGVTCQGPSPPGHYFPASDFQRATLGRQLCCAAPSPHLSCLSYTLRYIRSGSPSKLGEVVYAFLRISDVCHFFTSLRK
jgi:hypothetical protein